MNRFDRIAEWLRPHEVQPALNLVGLLEECGQMTPWEAEEWRRRIEGWARFHAVDTECPPGA